MFNLKQKGNGPENNRKTLNEMENRPKWGRGNMVHHCFTRSATNQVYHIELQEITPFFTQSHPLRIAVSVQVTARANSFL